MTYYNNVLKIIYILQSYKNKSSTKQKEEIMNLQPTGMREVIYVWHVIKNELPTQRKLINWKKMQKIQGGYIIT